ncbi:hypothetical protein [Piscinibacter sakaiensis]|uniref:hypothetical protein n=1 Tax=Piscinibacter sakaiensis TaxID=1547922 RepID=UPI00372D5455
MALTGPALDEALVLLYRHLDPEDLEDADAILETIETLEPAEDLATAVEELVRATLLLADIGRPQRRPRGRGWRHRARHSTPRRRGGPSRHGIFGRYAEAPRPPRAAPEHPWPSPTFPPNPPRWACSATTRC